METSPVDDTAVTAAAAPSRSRALPMVGAGEGEARIGDAVACD